MQKNKLFDTELGCAELLVTYNEEIKHNTPRKEYCHGEHEFNEDEVNIELLSVEVIIPKGQSIDILPMLSEKQKEYIIYNLSE